MCLCFIAGDLVALQRELKPRHTRGPTGPVDLQIWFWCVQWWWWSTKGAKEGGSHWCPGRGFLFRSLDPQMMWGKKWKPSCTFFSFEDYSWPLSDRWRKAQMQCQRGPSEWKHFNVKLLKWAQLMTRRRTIVIHDNLLKQSQVHCDVLWQGRKIIYGSLK